VLAIAKALMVRGALDATMIDHHRQRAGTCAPGGLGRGFGERWRLRRKDPLRAASPVAIKNPGLSSNSV
jgi:hypothetical protein